MTALGPLIVEVEEEELAQSQTGQAITWRTIPQEETTNNVRAVSCVLANGSFHKLIYI